MGVSVNSGPSVVSGNTNPVQNSEPDQGPSLVFQGSGLTDPRFVGQIGGAPGTKIYGLYTNSYVVSTDAVPVVASATRVAAASAPAAGVALPLVTAQAAGVAPLLPVLPFGAAPISANLVSAVALDFGFAVGSVVSGSKVMTIPTGAWRYFAQNQRIIVAGGNGATAAPLITTVAAAVAPGATTVTLSDAAGATNTAVAVGACHPTLNAAWPFLSAGTIALFDPTQGMARTVSLTANAGATGQAVTVRGYDVYGQPMSEAITVVGGSTVNGKKAFKYVTSITPATTDAGHTISAGTTDVIGINFRSDFWEYMDVFMAGQFVTTSTGWTVADATSPATATTGDVRGTYALQTASNFDGTVANWPTSRRLAAFSSLPIFNTVNANNLNYVTLFGSTQA
jgi:hypothetical protein